MVNRAQSLRLVAIVFTDIVGYSAVINRDAVLGAKLLDRQRSVVRKCVPLYGGREVETAGDSFLLEFSSALKALECVADIQRRLTQANQQHPEAERVQIRASVHLGDVEHRGKEVFGDGVNVAARILPFSPEGGVAFSETVQQQVRNRIQVQAKSIGSPSLKNIAHPVEIFTLDAQSLLAIQSTAIPKAEAVAPHSKTILYPIAGLIGCAMIAGALLWTRHSATTLDAAPTIPKHSIAVLPFANLSEDPKNAYFADGMQDEILTALAKIHALKVISRTSTEQYRGKAPDLPAIAKALSVATVLEGSVQRIGNRVRINMQLIDVRTDAHLWAETYDRDLTDLFGVQSEVTRAITKALQASLLPAERNALTPLPTQNPRAYDLYLQAGAFARRAHDQNSLVSTQIPQAIALYDQALAEDPGFAMASAALSRAHMEMYWHALDRSAVRLAAAKSAAERALALQPELSEGHLALAYYHYWGQRDYAVAMEQLEMARQALPNSADVVGTMAFIARRQGRFEEALRGLKQALVIDPQNTKFWDAMGEAYEVLRRYPDADTAYGRAVAVALVSTDQKVSRAQMVTVWKGDLAPLRAALGALALDSEDFHANAIAFYFMQLSSRDYAAALKTLASSPGIRLRDWWSANVILPNALLRARIYKVQGEISLARKAYEETARALEAELKQQPDDADLHVGLGLSYAGLGRHDDAVREGQRAVALLPVSKDAFSAPGYLKYLAEIYTEVGDHEHALEVLSQLLAMPAGHVMSPALLKLDPAWDPLRDDARFKALLAAPDKT